MNTPKKPGRPPGTDYHEDAAAMELMADAIVADRAKNAAEAARLIYKVAKCRGQSEDAIVARLSVKWRAKREMAMMRAKGRIQKVTPSVQMPPDYGAATTLPATAVAMSRPDPDRRSNTQKLLDAAAAPGMAEWARGVLGGGQSRSVHFLAAQQAARDAAKSLEAMGGASELHRRAEEARAAIEAAGGLVGIRRQADQARATMRDLGLHRRRDDT